MKPIYFILIFLILVVEITAVAVTPAKIEMTRFEERNVHVINNEKIGLKYEIIIPEWLNVNIKKFSLEPGEKKIVKIKTEESGKQGLIIVEEQFEEISNAIGIKINVKKQNNNNYFLPLVIVPILIIITLIIFRKKIINKIYKHLKFHNIK